MYKILKKYMKEYFEGVYKEENNRFVFYLYYSKLNAQVKHTLYTEKNKFICISTLPCRIMYNYESYDEEQIKVISKINNNSLYGYVCVDDNTREILFCVDLELNIGFSEYTEHIYVETLNKLIYHCRDVFMVEYGDVINDWFVI